MAMANRMEEDYFDITSSTPKITQKSPWQNTNPLQNDTQQHLAGHASSQVNGYQNFDETKTNDVNAFGGPTGNVSCDRTIHVGPLGVQGLTHDDGKSENLPNWDPMSDDYSCPTFNCYKSFNVLASEPLKQRSPNASVQTPEKQSVPDDISLYVANIPAQMTQQGLRNLFQGAGRVHSSCVLPPSDPSQERRIGFVTFQSWKEASKAIEYYDGFSLGNNVKLRVKVANRKTRRGSDNLTKDYDYGSNEEINSDVIDGCAPSNVNGFKERSVSVGENGNDPNTRHENNVTNSVRNEQAAVVSQTSTGISCTSPSGSSTKQRPCTKCQKLCTQRCSACKAPYCGRECQKADRVNHKAVCNYQGSAKPGEPQPKSPSTASTTKQPEHDDLLNEIDFDCIDISTDDVADKMKKGGKADQMPNEQAASKEETSSHTQISCHVSGTSLEPLRRLTQLPPAPSLAPNVFRLLVTTVASGNSFWAQVVDDQVFPRFVGTTQQMGKIGEDSLESVTRPFPGLCCLTRFSLDGCWYRSRVEQFTKDKVEVFFVDYGNKEWKDIQELYHLPSQFSSLPGQARLFTMNSVTMSQNMDVQRKLLTFLDGLVSGKTIDAEVVSVVPGCNPEVVVCETSSQKTMNEMVKEHQIGLESNLNMNPSLPPSQPIGPPKSDPIQRKHVEPMTKSQDPQSSGLPHEIVPPPPSTPSSPSGFKTYMASDVANEMLPVEKTFDIFVTEISSPSLFWIQLPDTAIDKLNLLSTLLDVSYKDSVFSDYVPSVGELIVAKFTDRLFYRAKVDFIYNDGTLRVTFVDFGNSEDVRLYDVRRITQELVVIPKLAIKCGLFGVESSSKAGGWPVECTNLCKALMLNKRCTASVEGHLRDSVLLRVWGSADPNEPVCVVNDELVMKGQSKSAKQELIHKNAELEHSASRDDGFVENGKQQVENHHSGSVTRLHLDNRDLIVPTEGKNVKPQHFQRVQTPHCVSPNPAIGQSPNLALVEHKTPSYPSQHSPFAHSTSRRTSSESCHSILSSRSQTPEPNYQSSSAPSNQRGRTLPLPNIPCKAFDIVVNDVISGGQLYVQMIDPQLVRMLHKCVRELNQFCKNSKQRAAVNVEVGSLGCAKFSLDNVWYRAEVISMEITGYRVRFVDFGNTEVVAPDAFLEPPEFFYELAPLAFRCRLATSDESADSWGERSKDVLLKITRNKRLSCTAVSTTRSPYTVKLELCSGGQRIDVAKELQKDLSSRSFSEEPSSNRPNSSSSGDGRNRSTFSELVLRPAITNAAIGSHGDKFEVLVTEVFHPTYFWAQLALRSSIEEMNRLTEDLNAHYSRTSYPQFQVRENSFCACKFSLDNTWYRGFVKSEGPKGIMVHFVDFGNSEMTTAEMLRPLENQFMEQPFRAILCSMACVEPAEGKFWSKEAIEYFKSKVTGNVLRCTVITNSKSRLFIDIQDPESESGRSLMTDLVENDMAKEVGGYSLSLEMKSFPPEHKPRTSNLNETGRRIDDNKGFVEPSDPTVAENSFLRSSAGNLSSFNCGNHCFGDSEAFRTTSSAFSTNPLHRENHLTNPKKKNMPFDNDPLTSGHGMTTEQGRVMASKFTYVTVDLQNPVKVLVTDVSGPDEIYFQVVEAKCCASLNALSESLNVQFANTNQSYIPMPGELCCALFSVDKCWYRVVVCTVNVTTGLAVVQFLDYGNRDSVAFSFLRPITLSLTKLPFQARQARLAQEASEGTTWTPDRIAYLRTLLSGKPLMAKVVREVQDVLEMEFYDIAGESNILINALFTEQGYPERKSQPANVPIPSLSSIPEAVPTETELQVVVTEVSDPGCFWVQNIVMDTVNQFTAMTRHINSLCERCHGGQLTLNVGDVCCSKFAFDGQWYRARVEGFLENGLVRVFYVDFGNCEEVDPSGLKPLDQAFVHFPAQGLQCKLANVQPTNGPWSGRAMEWLKSKILGKRLFARVVGRNGSVLHVELIDTSDADRDVFINSEMIQTGEAKVA